VLSHVSRVSALGVLMALAVSACGSSSTSSSGAGSGSSVCQGTPAKPGFTNGVAQVSGEASQLSRRRLDIHQPDAVGVGRNLRR